MFDALMTWNKIVHLVSDNRGGVPISLAPPERGSRDIGLNLDHSYFAIINTLIALLEEIIFPPTYFSILA
jgi:hypothetical protein